MAKLAQTQETIAKKIGVSRVAVAQYLAGASKPGPERRAKMAELFGIPPGSWDTPLALTPVVAARVVPAVVNVQAAPNILHKVAELEAMVYSLMLKIQEDDDTTYQEQAKALSSLAQTMSILTKLLGQDNLGARIFKLPVWKQIEAAVQRGLAGHPAAAKAVAKELRQLEDQYTS